MSYFDQRWAPCWALVWAPGFSCRHGSANIYVSPPGLCLLDWGESISHSKFLSSWFITIEAVIVHLKPIASCIPVPHKNIEFTPGSLRGLHMVASALSNHFVLGTAFLSSCSHWSTNVFSMTFMGPLSWLIKALSKNLWSNSTKTDMWQTFTWSFSCGPLRYGGRPSLSCAS